MRKEKRRLGARKKGTGSPVSQYWVRDPTTALRKPILWAVGSRGMASGTMPLAVGKRRRLPTIEFVMPQIQNLGQD